MYMCVLCYTHKLVHMRIHRIYICIYVKTYPGVRLSWGAGFRVRKQVLKGEEMFSLLLLSGGVGRVRLLGHPGDVGVCVCAFYVCVCVCGHVGRASIFHSELVSGSLLFLCFCLHHNLLYRNKPHHHSIEISTRGCPLHTHTRTYTSR